LYLYSVEATLRDDGESADVVMEWHARTVDGVAVYTTPLTVTDLNAGVFYSFAQEQYDLAEDALGDAPYSLTFPSKGTKSRFGFPEEA
jgi:hypothetical protein